MPEQTAEQVLLRPQPPALEFRCPDCPICAKETDSDGDGFTCQHCEVSWGSNGEDGEWFDADEPGCPSVIEWWNTDRLEAKFETIRHETDRCVLGADHLAQHQAFDDWHKWDDDDPRIVLRPTAPTQDGA